MSLLTEEVVRFIILGDIDSPLHTMDIEEVVLSVEDLVSVILEQPVPCMNTIRVRVRLEAACHFGYI